MRKHRRGEGGGIDPVSEMRGMKVEYVELYRKVFGEDPRSEDLRKLTGGI